MAASDMCLCLAFTLFSSFPGDPGAIDRHRKAVLSDDGYTVHLRLNPFVLMKLFFLTVCPSVRVVSPHVRLVVMAAPSIQCE